MASSFNDSPRGSRPSQSTPAGGVTLTCQGTTASGRSCRRTIEYDLSQKHLREPDWRSPEVYCHDHQDQAPDYDPSTATPRAKRTPRKAKGASEDTYSTQVHVQIEMSSKTKHHRTLKTKSSRASFRLSSSEEEGDDDFDDDDEEEEDAEEYPSSPQPKRQTAKPKVSKAERPAAKVKPPRASLMPTLAQDPFFAPSTPQSKIQPAKISASAPPKFNHSIIQSVFRHSEDSLLEKLSLLTLNDNKPKPTVRPTAALAPPPRPAAHQSFTSWSLKICCSSFVTFDPNDEEEQEEPPRPYRPGLPTSRIPPLSEKTAAELAKVIASKPSKSDKPGYIYIFRHTSSPDQPNSPNGFSKKGRILLKIGRAGNVHDRMKQWEKQCQSPVQLLRYYPQDDQIAAPRKGLIIRDRTPHVFKVEERIHLELKECNAKLNACSGCGKTHQEWFWIDGSKEGVQELDLLIRRVITWDYEMTAQNAEWRENAESASLVKARR